MTTTAVRPLLITGIYTLTPTHCGTGQTAGAIDLPIARESHTGLPLIPATTLKGVARDFWFDDRDAANKELVRRLFGSDPPRSRGEAVEPATSETEQRDDGEGNGLRAGDLVFLDGLLIAFPVRSLTGVFRLVTSPLLLQRLRRLAIAHGGWLDSDFVCPTPGAGEALVAEERSAGPLSLEDLVIPKARCRVDDEVARLAGAIARLVSMDEADADRQAMRRRLVVVEDDVLQDLTRRATTVTARIALHKERKTSDNLWYEETLAPDCLFASIVAGRPGAYDDPVDDLRQKLPATQLYTQIGGNGTVGCGQCRWVVKPEGVLS